MYELLSISGEIGSISHDNFILKKIDDVIRKRKYNQICNKIHDICKYITNAEIAEFIKCISCAYNPKPHIEIKNIQGDDKFIIEYYNNNSIHVSWYTNFENDLYVSIFVDMSENKIVVGNVAEKNAFRYNILSHDTIDYDPRAILSAVIESELKYICKCLIYKEVPNYVH